MTVNLHADLVAGLTTLPEVVEAKPSVVLEFYEFGVILRKPREDGATAFAVDPEAVWQALSAKASVETGLLQEGTLYYARSGDSITVIEYRPPQMTGIWLEGSENAYRIPLPGLILVRQLNGQRPEYMLYAVKARPTQSSDPLYRAPLPHVGHDSGAICWGTVAFPDPKVMKKSTSLAEDWKLLLGSRFGNHTVNGLSRKHTKDVRALYADLEARKVKKYPLEDLRESKLNFGGLLARLRQ